MLEMATGAHLKAFGKIFSEDASKTLPLRLSIIFWSSSFLRERNDERSIFTTFCTDIVCRKMLATGSYRKIRYRTAGLASDASNGFREETYTSRSHSSNGLPLQCLLLKSLKHPFRHSEVQALDWLPPRTLSLPFSVRRSRETSISLQWNQIKNRILRVLSLRRFECSEPNREELNRN